MNSKPLGPTLCRYCNRPRRTGYGDPCEACVMESMERIASTYRIIDGELVRVVPGAPPQLQEKLVSQLDVVTEVRIYATDGVDWNGLGPPTLGVKNAPIYRDRLIL